MERKRNLTATSEQMEEYCRSSTVLSKIGQSAARKRAESPLEGGTLRNISRTTKELTAPKTYRRPEQRFFTHKIISTWTERVESRSQLNRRLVAINWRYCTMFVVGIVNVSVSVSASVSVIGRREEQDDDIGWYRMMIECRHHFLQYCFDEQ